MKRIRKILFSVLVLGVAWLVPAIAAAQQDVADLGAFKDWKAQTFTEKGKIVCTMWSEPTESAGEYKKRGPVYIFVTHRPYANRIDEISINIGYTFKKAAPVGVSIGSREYALFSGGDTAWTRTSKEDRRLVRAMRAGSNLTISGISSRGTKTTDTFSLSGFTAAYNTITKACKAR
ncbi:MAG: invasion associated locus B family protein [Alphaproteobacteria bacterium]